MKYYLFSLGCKVNSYECNALSSLLNQKGYSEDKLHPDVVIINTCSVTATADQKSRQHIRKFKTLFPDAIIAVMGCYTQGHGDFIANNIHPDILIGTSHRNELPDLIRKFNLDHQPIYLYDENPRKYHYEEFGVTSFSENVRSYLKIQDGCDNFCSYCLIPYVRGKSRSRDYHKILDEANHLIEQGYKEIVLTGIHVGGYGKDLNSYSFSHLVDDLTNHPNLFRLRISSIEESEIDEQLISFINTRNNLAKHFHIPLQAGSNAILKAMNRKYNKEQFIEKLNLIKKSCPDVALTTDVIVGFPGESDEDFNETIDTIKKCGFQMLHVFPFSPREGTLAYKMKDQIDPRIKKQRAKILIDLSNQLWDAYKKSCENKEVEVLIEKYDADKKVNIGHTSNYLEVAIPGDVSQVGSVIKTIYKFQ